MEDHLEQLSQNISPDRILNILDQFKGLFTTISTIEDSVAAFFRSMADGGFSSYNESMQNMIVEECQTYLESLHTLIQKYQRYEGVFRRHLDIAENNFRSGEVSEVVTTNCSVFRELLDLVRRHIVNLESKEEANKRNFRRMKGGLDVEIFESFDVVAYGVSDEQSDTDVCCICLLSRLLGQSILILPCRHRYHYECATLLFETSTKCAICKRDFSKNETINLTFNIDDLD